MRAPTAGSSHGGSSLLPAHPPSVGNSLLPASCAELYGTESEIVAEIVAESDDERADLEADLEGGREPLGDRRADRISV